MSKKTLTKRMTFGNIEEIVQEMDAKEKDFCFVYLGHLGNWEWIASLPYWVPDNLLCGQIYHPLRNKVFDKLLLAIRSKFGGECIPMKSTLRRVIKLKQQKQKTIIGFISDQAPAWNSIHHFCSFMGQETAVHTGTEQIGKQVDALIYYARITRKKRGYYHCEFVKITDDSNSYSNYQITDLFTQNLEAMINENPSIYLWSHNRWKRSKSEWLQRAKHRANRN